MLCFSVSFGVLAGILVGYLRRGYLGFAAYALVFAVAFWFLSFLIFPLNIPGFVISIWLAVFFWGAYLLLTTIKALFIERYS